MTVTALADVQPRPRRVAIGEFDGVHLGHREVIRGADTVLTFEPHPRVVVTPDAAPKLLTSLALKGDLIADLGVAELVVIEFNREFASKSAQQFVDQVLVERLSAEHVRVGENFRFGHKAAGDTALLESQGAFATTVAQLVEVEGEIVSSSHIRGLVLAGEVRHATEFLGRPFELRGIVVEGDKRGRELGFPTANLVPDDALVCPGNGVYACLASTDGESWVAAAVNVGVRPTFESGRGLLVEAFLIDWDGDLYGQELRLRFVERLRGERAFTSAAALIEQMERDVAEAGKAL